MSEREIVEQHFAGRLGRFLEIGAYDGVTSSLTDSLVLAGWEGVQVEPEPIAFTKLMENRRGHPHIQLVNAAVSVSAGIAEFWAQDGGGEVSTLCEQHRQFFETRDGTRYHRPYFIQTLSVEQLLAAFGTRWDMLLIDAEGISLEVLCEFPLADMPETTLVCTEFDAGPNGVVAALSPWYDTQEVGVNVIGIRR
jgi:FkbM family methyltransferase